MKKIMSKQITSKIFPVLIWTLLFFWTLIFGVILVWALITSVKSGIDFYYNPMGLPKKEFGGWQFANFVTAAQNSLLYAGGSSFLAVATACIASYCVCKFRHLKWVGWVWGIVLVTNYLPISASLAGNIKFLTDLHLYDNIFGMWLWSAGAFGAMFLYYYATWKGVSWGYAEAALVEPLARVSANHVAHDAHHIRRTVSAIVYRHVERLHDAYDLFAEHAYHCIRLLATSVRRYGRGCRYYRAVGGTHNYSVAGVRAIYDF